MTAYPFIFHSISLSLFASVIGPFGGFFASGFKRAFRIKVSRASSCLSTKMGDCRVVFNSLASPHLL